MESTTPRRPMRVAVTGASGNVGTALLRRLSAPAPGDLPGNPPRDGDGDPIGASSRMADVVGIARRLPPSDQPPYSGVEWVSLDVAGAGSQTRLSELFRGVDAVVHTAWLIQPARDPAEMARVNLGGSRAVFQAAVAAGVPHLVHLSSVGVYAPHPGNDPRVDESWAATGIPTSQYSREKAVVEADLDQLERSHPELQVSRMRPALVFQRDAGSEIARYFMGGLVPARVLRRVPLPLLPLPRGLRLQVVHSDDLADAIARVLQRGVGEGAGGAYNVADEPVLGGRDVGSAMRAGRLVALDHRLTRAVVDVTYRAHIHPVQPGWLDLGLGVPLLDTNRARRELGWSPSHAARDVLVELLEGIQGHDGTSSPALRSRSLLSARSGT
ncbi:MAG: NAD-dependent epimerase/dehydratase family protein [Janthinobacterium lividum]